MKSLVPFLAVPAILAGAVSASPWLIGRMLAPEQPIRVPAVTLPPGAREIAGGAEGAAEPLRLEALMPAILIDSATPPAAAPERRAPAERYRLASVLLSPEKSSAVINGQVVFAGSRLDEFRVTGISGDRVVLVGPGGAHTVRLESDADRPLFRAVKRKDGGGLSIAPPTSAQRGRAAGEPPLSDDELERQYRRLLDNLDH